MNFYQLLTVIKSSYINKSKSWPIKKTNQTLKSLKFAYSLNFILYKTFFNFKRSNLALVPLYFNSILLLNDIRFFPSLRYTFLIDYKSYRRLTFLIPSCVLIIKSSTGLITNFDYINKRKSGQILAYCV